MNVAAAKLKAQALVNGIPTSFTWNGGTYSGARSQLKAERVAADAGLAGKYDFSLLCSLAQFSLSVPVSKQTVTVSGTEYRILTTDTDAFEACIRLNLGTLYAR